MRQKMLIGNDGSKDLQEELSTGKKSERNFLLTPRDLEILRFVLEMKFASLMHIHQKFFLKNGVPSKGESRKWAQTRLRQLKRSGYLSSSPILCSRKHQYLVTRKGQLLLQNMSADEEILPILRSVDIRTFDHDSRVLDCRLILEQVGRATSWDSERRIRSEFVPRFNLEGQFIPDGIYRNRDGKNIAFELETAVKEPRRYKEKINRYVETINRAREFEYPLVGVLFVASGENVFKKLKALTEKYPNHFQVERYLELMTTSNLKSQKEKG